MNPASSLVARIIWLVVGLAASFALAASLWVGQVAREIVVQQHLRRLSLEADQFASDLEDAINARLQALGNMPERSISRRGFDGLIAQNPHLGFIALADAAGRVVAGGGGVLEGSDVSTQPWFSNGLRGPWIGMLEMGTPDAPTPLPADFSAPVTDSAGRPIGVALAHLRLHWAARDAPRLGASLDARAHTQATVLDHAGLVVVGADGIRDRPWNGKPAEPRAQAGANDDLEFPQPRFERLPDGRTVVTARAPVQLAADAPAGWYVQLSESKDVVYLRANDLAARIWWISASLGAATAILGALGARRLTNRLKRLTESAAAVGRNEIERIEAPGGSDEVAQLAAAFAKVLDDLRQERAELLKLSADLERRVLTRTREVERLAEESRYSAIVRERLKIARDLHDTLAHSMMAMLSEVRMLRRLHTHDPQSLAAELSRAEEVAREGLKEARTAIAQMRFNAVRDTGLGPALASAFDRFLERTGLSGTFEADPGAARFGDERAETLFRMAEEALRNVERHAMASRVEVALTVCEGNRLSLRIADDGIGFDAQAPHPEHYGLIGLAEQSRLIGADLRIDSGADRGTRISVTLPIAPEAL
jgi:signal transduction histidine kinase